MEFQSKSICLSTRVIAGGPVERVVGEVLAVEALVAGAGRGAELVRGMTMRCVLGVGRALRVENLRGAELLDDAVDGEDGVFGDGVVVALDGGERGGVGADDGDGFDLRGCERKDVVVVLEQHHRLARGAESERGVGAASSPQRMGLCDVEHLAPADRRGRGDSGRGRGA